MDLQGEPLGGRAMDLQSGRGTRGGVVRSFGWWLLRSRWGLVRGSGGCCHVTNLGIEAGGFDRVWVSADILRIELYVCANRFFGGRHWASGLRRIKWLPLI